MRVLLSTTLLATACATLPFPSPGTQVEYYHPRAEQIMERLKAAIPEQDRPPMIRYQVWSAPGVAQIGHTLAADPDTGIIYIYARCFEANDDVLAVGLGHEIYHVLEHRRTKPLVALGWVGGSAGAGATVGYLTTWWLGLLAGAGVFAIVLPPVILAGIREGEDHADQFGVELAWRAGYNVKRGVEAWCEIHRAIARHLENPGLTHPLAEQRCASMRAAFLRAQYSR